MNYTIAKNTLSLPVIPLRGLVALPGVVLQFDVGREKSVKAVDAVMQKNQLVFLTAQTEVYIDDPAMEELYRVGTVARIKQVLKMPGENIRVLAEGLYRGYMVAGTAASPYLTADVGSRTTFPGWIPFGPRHICAPYARHSTGTSRSRPRCRAMLSCACMQRTTPVSCATISRPIRR